MTVKSLEYHSKFAGNRLKNNAFITLYRVQYGMKLVSLYTCGYLGKSVEDFLKGVFRGCVKCNL